MNEIIKRLASLFAIIIIIGIAPAHARQDSSTFKSAFSEEFHYYTGSLRADKYHIYVSEKDTVYAKHILSVLKAGKVKVYRRALLSRQDGSLISMTLHPQKKNPLQTIVRDPVTLDTLSSYIQESKKIGSFQIKGEHGITFKIQKDKDQWNITQDGKLIGNWKMLYKNKRNILSLNLAHQPSEESIKAWEYFIINFATEQIIMKHARVRSIGTGIVTGLLKALL